MTLNLTAMPLKGRKGDVMKDHLNRACLKTPNHINSFTYLMESSFHDLVVFQQVQGFCFNYGDFREQKNLEIEILTLASGTSPTSLTSDRGIKHTTGRPHLPSAA